jgi:uncharacterized protein YbbK (DUF523 family)/uncharacterized protein YbgA (DUF1722 family)
MDANGLHLLPARIPVGVSSCLLGEPVSWDGGHRHNPYLTGTLARWFQFVPVCPEMGIGLGAPRPPIRLVGRVQAPRVVGADDPGLEVTGPLTDYGRRMAGELGAVCGYLFKARSPSCGMARVPVYRPQGGRPLLRGVGQYARAFMAARPELPCEEDEGLSDPARRASFVTRVVALARWQALAARGITPATLAAFHSAHALVLAARGAERSLRPLLAQARRRPGGQAVRRYLLAFMAVLSRPGTRRGHAAVLARLVEVQRRRLDAADYAELRDWVRGYRAGALPLAMPLALLRHHFRRHPHPAAAGQVYLEPHPAELMLGDPG